MSETGGKGGREERESVSVLGSNDLDTDRRQLCLSVAGHRHTPLTALVNKRCSSNRCIRVLGTTPTPAFVEGTINKRRLVPRH